MAASDIVHGEAIYDGDSSGGVAMILYESGSVTVRTLGADEYLVVTDVTFFTEAGGDLFLVADSKAAGRYLLVAGMAGNGGYDKQYKTSYRCPKGKGLKLFGVATHRDMAIIEGYITQA